MKCHICGADKAQVRSCEIETALITGRAHVDCGGHAQYRSLTLEELKIIKSENAVEMGRRML